MKKIKITIYLIFLSFISFAPFKVLGAEDYSLYENTCNDPNVLQAFKLVGTILLIVKVIVPILLVAFGMYHFFQAFFSGDDKGLGKALKTLLSKIIAGLVIFFIPTIVLTVISLISPATGINETDKSGTYVKCTKCLLNPTEYCN